MNDPDIAPPHFGVGTFEGPDAEAFPALVSGGLGMDLRPVFGSVRTADLFATWDETLPRLEECASRIAEVGDPIADWRPLAPVDPPGQIFCAGANYTEHVREIFRSMAWGAPEGVERTEAEITKDIEATLARHREGGQPFVFTVPPSALCGAEDEIILWGPGSHHDWELELAVVIGRRGRDIAEADALEQVAGYTISNDVSTRDVMKREDIALTDFLMTKGRPTFLPTGPLVVPRQFVPDYRALNIGLSVNGETMQDSEVSDIIFGVEKIISYVSSVSELQPGDLILTGSPAGNAGHHGNRWLSPGDEIVGQITGLGLHRNVCVADPRPQGSVLAPAR